MAGGKGEEVLTLKRFPLFFQMTLTAKVLAEHKVREKGRNECFFEPKFTGATCKYAGFSMHAREAVTAGAWSEEASC